MLVLCGLSFFIPCRFWILVLCWMSSWQNPILWVGFHFLGFLISRFLFFSLEFQKL
jgi:hypothetical protein